MVQGFDSSMEETLLTMDVVDSLRHEEARLDGHANIQEKMDVMKSRLARLYRQQGIDVSDAIIEAGVKAKIEDRFIHRPAKGFSASLVKAYVERGKWALRGLMATVGGAVVYACYFGLVIWPAIVGTNQFNDRVLLLDDKRGEVQSQASDMTRLVSELAEPLGRETATVLRLRSQASADIDEAKRIVTSIESPLMPPITVSEFREGIALETERLSDTERRVEEAAKKLRTAQSGLSDAESVLRLYREWSELNGQIEQQEFSANFRGRLNALSSGVLRSLIAPDVASARKGLADMAAGMQGYRQLESMRDEAQDLRDLGVAEAKSDKAKAAIQAQYAVLKSALDESNVAAGRTAMADLRTGVESLIQSYSLRIVSGEGQRSGVWRHPNDNNSIRNYYLIVEALNPAGRAMRLPIKNEETGRVERVTQWGVRVPELIYEKVKQDKLDNQLIDHPEAGEKRRGEMEPDWAFDVAGGFITNW